MNRENTKTCASCESFPLYESAQHGGKAMCPWFEREHAWNDGACVLHNDAPDIKERKKVVAQLVKQPQQQEK
jgi:hypothetical protein